MTKGTIFRFIPVLIFILLGIGTIIFFVKTAQKPLKTDKTQLKQKVLTLNVQKYRIHPFVKAYGIVNSSKIWNAASEVSGRLIFVHPDLKNGMTLNKETVLIKIDPADYEIKLQTAKTELLHIDASKNEINTTRQNQEALLKIEKQSLELVEKEYARQNNLYNKKSVSLSALDSAKTVLLGAKQKVTSLENSLRLIPVSLKKLEAMEKSALLKIKEARRALDKTVITLPFKARIGEVFLEKDQFISIGQPLFKAYGTDLAEIAISLTMDQLKSIIPIEKLSLLNTANINPDTPDLKENILGTREFIDKIGLKGTVFLEMSGISPTWEAKFTRFTQGLDPVTRTVGLIAAVDRPYDKMIPGQRPPLLKGMHVKVILQNPDFEELYLMPRHACENNTVLTINSKGLLKKLLLKPDFIIDNLCGFKSGFENSDKIITSHLIPAIQDSSVLTESDTKWQNIINDQIRKYGQAE